MYGCRVIDVHSRTVAGWAIDSRQATNLVLNALYLAVEAGLVRSMETIGDGYDNVMIELFGGIMHGELLHRKMADTVGVGLRHLRIHRGLLQPV